MPNNRYVKKMLIESLLFNHCDQEVKKVFNNLSETEQKDLDFQLLKGKYYLITLQLPAAISQFQTILNNPVKYQTQNHTIKQYHQDTY